MPELPPSRHYFNVGHTSLNTPDILASLGARGIQSVVLLHDLIPITHPEFCRPGDGAKHRERVLTALKHASRIIVNSRYTAAELAAFAEREGVTAPPIDAVHLGLEPIFMTRPPAAAPRPYFVHVGTIEARKNLAFLLTIWRRLQERMGDKAPQLVLVGRYGWENEAVLDHLQRSPNLRGLVHQATNLPDAALATLMNNAQAVLAPSSVEGFDLPAVEACALGVPLIASDIPAHRELVPNAQLIDPLDGLGWLAALEQATALRPSAPSFAPPTWDAHFAAVAQRIGLDPRP
jgi:glycosyltransferase involved in cell wall biosynthesis